MAESVAPTLTSIPGILEEHFEELAFLWGQREKAVRSPAYTMRALAMLEERIEAHVQGLLRVGPQVISLAEEDLSSEDALTVFGAAYPLLRLQHDRATSRVLEAFTAAKGRQLDGLRQALSHGSMEPVKTALHALFFSSDVAIAAAAADIIAFHSGSPLPGKSIEHLLQDEDSAVRQTAWRVVANSGLSLEAKLYAAAMRDENLGVRRAALLAAAWNAEPGSLLLARQLAEAPRPDNLHGMELLGVLGKVEDMQRIILVAESKGLGPVRFRVLGCFGHPALVELLLAELSNPDPATACAAGAAFTKITGENIDSKTRTKLPPEDGHEPDEFEAEFLEEVRLPDPEIARRHWEKMKPRFARATRICRGFDISQGVTAEALANFDMESRWEFYLRSRFMRTWSGSPASLEKFPQPR